MKADVKSSGIAAPVAQPHHPGGLGASLFPDFSDDLRTGANNFFLMRNRIQEIGDSTASRFGEGTDGTDYKAMALQIETTILANLLGSGKEVREGFLRAMADYLWAVEVGAGPGDSWSYEDALKCTGLAYAGFKSMEVSHA